MAVVLIKQYWPCFCFFIILYIFLTLINFSFNFLMQTATQ